MSRLTSTAQCERETSGSSISMSAPPCNRPMVISGFDTSNSIPCDAPVRTEIWTAWFNGNRNSLSAEFFEGRIAPHFFCRFDCCIAIVGGLTSHETAGGMGKVRIQQVFAEAPVARK